MPLPSPAIAAMIHISFPSRTHAEEKPASVSSILLPIKENRAKELQRFTMSLKALAGTQLCVQLDELFSLSAGQTG